MSHPQDPCKGCGTYFVSEEDEATHDCIFTQTSGSTFCDGDRRDNVWLEGADATGAGGACLLDTMTQAEITFIVQRDDRARSDLRRVTSNQDLQELADTVKRLEGAYEGDILQTQLGQVEEPILLYTQFRGQPPFGQ